MGIFHEVAEAGRRGRILYKKSFEFPAIVDTTVREGDTVLMVEELTARVLMAQIFSTTGKYLSLALTYSLPLDPNFFRVAYQMCSTSIQTTLRSTVPETA